MSVTVQISYRRSSIGIDQERQHIWPCVVTNWVGGGFCFQNHAQIEIGVQNALLAFRQRLRKRSAAWPEDAREATTNRDQGLLVLGVAESVLCRLTVDLCGAKHEARPLDRI